MFQCGCLDLFMDPRELGNLFCIFSCLRLYIVVGEEEFSYQDVPYACCFRSFFKYLTDKAPNVPHMENSNIKLKV